MGRASFPQDVVAPPLMYVKYTAVVAPHIYNLAEKNWLRRTPYNLCRASLAASQKRLRRKTPLPERERSREVRERGVKMKLKFLLAVLLGLLFTIVHAA